MREKKGNNNLHSSAFFAALVSWNRYSYRPYLSDWGEKCRYGFSTLVLYEHTKGVVVFPKVLLLPRLDRRNDEKSIFHNIKEKKGTKNKKGGEDPSFSTRWWLKQFQFSFSFILFIHKLTTVIVLVTIMRKLHYFKVTFKIYPSPFSKIFIKRGWW